MAPSLSGWGDGGEVEEDGGREGLSEDAPPNPETLPARRPLMIRNKSGSFGLGYQLGSCVLLMF
jgi:hypothetical protein